MLAFIESTAQSRVERADNVSDFNRPLSSPLFPRSLLPQKLYSASLTKVFSIETSVSTNGN